MCAQVARVRELAKGLKAQQNKSFALHAFMEEWSLRRLRGSTNSTNSTAEPRQVFRDDAQRILENQSAYHMPDK